jgi:hypothetical protein
MLDEEGFISEGFSLRHNIRRVSDSFLEGKFDWGVILLFISI